MSRLWYEQPAMEWEEALPLGNGRLGAMVFGEPVKEHLQMNEDSVWYGGKVDRNNPDTLKNLPEIRRLILAGEIGKAEHLMQRAMSGCPESMHPYQSLGDIFFTFEGLGEITSYQRELDLSKALCHVSFESEGVHFDREYFISEPDDVMVLHLTADKPGKISFQAILRRERFYNGIKRVETQNKTKGLCLYGDLGRDGMEFAMEMCATARGGRVSVMGEHLLVEEADEVFVYISAGTTFRMKHVEKELQDIITLAERKSYEEVKKTHIADYQSFYNRVDFELEGTKEGERIPTDVRIGRAGKGEVDLGLSKLYFDFGRYLLISCSREGTLPATLQGLWNNKMSPAWDSKYTININTQMNYWPAESLNLTECHQPLFELIGRMVPNGEKTAKVMYGCRGFVAHHNTDIWGDCAPQDLWIPGSYWVMGAAWLCTHQWTHYQYTKDVEFLRENFSIMRKAALFFLDFLIEDDGYLKTCPSVSPENTFVLPSGEKGANTAGVTMDNQILRDLFTQCIEAAAILGVEDDLNEQLKIVRARLVPTQIGEKGNILEWPKDYEELEPGHRHISHLYGLHPSEQITMDGTPELAKAARTTLERRLANGGGHTGWSRAWIINDYAKLWDGDKAYENLEQLFAKSTLPNLFDNHPPFQIDGNFGATAAIGEMLVQSTLERIVLLPALPKAWATGSIKGIRVKGNGKISVRWENGSLVEAILKADSDLDTVVRYQDKSVSVHMKQKEVRDLTKELTV